MIKAIRGGVLMLLFAAAWVNAAQHFDGKTPLVCTVARYFECDDTHGCFQIEPDEVGMARHLKVDFKAKRISLALVDHPDVSEIDSVETVDGKLILNGIEDGDPNEQDGGGWTMAINQAYGTLVMTLAGEVAFVGIGGCIPAR